MVSPTSSLYFPADALLYVDHPMILQPVLPECFHLVDEQLPPCRVQKVIYNRSEAKRSTLKVKSSQKTTKLRTQDSFLIKLKILNKSNKTKANVFRNNMFPSSGKMNKKETKNTSAKKIRYEVKKADKYFNMKKKRD